MANHHECQHKATDLAFLEVDSMLGARKRRANDMDLTPSVSTTALCTMVSWQASDMEAYLLSELQRALLLHHLAVVLRSRSSIGATAAAVADELQRIVDDGVGAGAARRVLSAFLKSHRGRFVWSMVPTDATEWVDMCLPLDLRDVYGNNLVEHLLKGRSTKQLACLTSAVARGVHIPPVRLVEWPLALVQSPCFLKYVLEHVAAEDAALDWQDSDGRTVTMRIVSMEAASGEYEEVQRLWLEKWSASDCCSRLQDSTGDTVAMYLAMYGSDEVQRFWLEKWSPDDCCPGLQDSEGYTVAILLVRAGSADVQRLWLEKWSVSDCCPELRDSNLVHSGYAAG